MQVKGLWESAFERDVWEVSRAVTMASWMPYHHDLKGNEAKAEGLEAYARRLEQIREEYSLGDSDAAKHLAEAQRYMREKADALRAFPKVDVDRSRFAALPMMVEVRVNQALHAYRGVKEMPAETAHRLDGMVEGVRTIADQLRAGKPAEALKAIEQLLRGARELRADLVKQVERGMER